jgi:hypothetical protein
MPAQASLGCGSIQLCRGFVAFIKTFEHPQLFKQEKKGPILIIVTEEKLFQKQIQGLELNLKVTIL